MISPLSRYQSATENKDGETFIVLNRRKDVVPNYTTYRVRDNESFQSIATRFLGSPVLYWRIAELNPQVPFPDFIPYGTTIRIPQ